MWYACAVIDGFDLDAGIFDHPIKLDGDLQIERIPEWVKADSALANLSWTDRTAIRDAKLAFVFRYEADALGSPDPEWTYRGNRSIQATIDEKISLAAFSLWLVLPSPLFGNQILHFSREGDSDSLRTAGSLNPIYVGNHQTENVPGRKDFDKAIEIYKSILALPRNKNVWSAMRVLLEATMAKRWEIRYPLLWIVLEGLFGPDDAREITFRISQRISLFFGKDAPECVEIFNKIKSGYAWRSKIVHGMRIASLTEEKSRELMVFLDELTRLLISRLLLDKDLIQVFDGNNREEYLDSLLFKRIK